MEANDKKQVIPNITRESSHDEDDSMVMTMEWASACLRMVAHAKMNCGIIQVMTIVATKLSESSHKRNCDRSTRHDRLTFSRPNSNRKAPLTIVIIRRNPDSMEP